MVADADHDTQGREPAEPGEEPEPAEPGTDPEEPEPRRRVPTWDEIVFGARPE